MLEQFGGFGAVVLETPDVASAQLSFVNNDCRAIEPMPSPAVCKR
jgi:hypothetical protein